MKAIIIGPLRFEDPKNEEKFQAFASILKNYGIETVIPHDLFDIPEKKSMEDPQKVKRLVQHVCQCDIVMTIEGWHLQKLAVKVVNHATELELEVIHEINLNKWLRKTNLLKEEKEPK